MPPLLQNIKTLSAILAASFILRISVLSKRFRHHCANGSQYSSKATNQTSKETGPILCFLIPFHLKSPEVFVLSCRWVTLQLRGSCCYANRVQWRWDVGKGGGGSWGDGGTDEGCSRKRARRVCIMQLFCLQASLHPVFHLPGKTTLLKRQNVRRIAPLSSRACEKTW